MYRTTYDKFAELVGDMVLCNNIPNFDTSVFDNMEFETTYKEEWDGEEYEREVDIYQWFITSCNEWRVEWLREHFPEAALFTYSDMLDCYILCVTHYGKPWSDVKTDTELENLAIK